VYADDCGFQYSNDPGMTGGFVGDFAEANWTLNYGDGDGTITFSETELVIVGNNDPFASENIYTLAITTVSESGLYAFTYGYSSNDSDANYDPAYYYNGSWVVLENAVGVTAGSGTLWILLEAGDEFGWAVESTDGCCGEATLFVKWFAHPGEGLECVPGCTNSLACNYDMAANADNGSCEFSSCAGCVYPGACNYNALATLDDGSCEYTSCAGCTYSDASNYDMMASVDDGSCMFDTATDSCPEDLDDNGEIGTSDLLIILAVYGADCPDPAP
jgi:hypothetical protein